MSEKELGGTPDHIAAAYERLPMPDARGRYEELGVQAEDGFVTVFHPLSAERRTIRLDVSEQEINAALASMVCEHMTKREKFLTLWRLAPERLGALCEGLRLAPADTRCPDHTIWQHLDTTAGVAAALEGGRGGIALLSFKLSPVQGFIEASRSLRDLATSSFILAYLTFAGMEPVLEELGPTAFMYPALRGIPLMDAWLRRRGIEAAVGTDRRAVASIPNRYLAVVPRVRAEALAKAARESAEKRWEQIAESVHQELKKHCDPLCADWDRLWTSQIKSYFDVRATWFSPKEVDFARLFGEEVFKEARKLDALGGKETTGLWQRSMRASAALMEAECRIRHIPQYHPAGDVPQKCTLLGTYEQMGPARLSDSRNFWAELAKKELVKETERLCAVSLVKRRAFPAFFRKELDLREREYRFESMQEIAGEEDRYYALVVMDGDDLGAWLQGEKSPQVREVVHEKIVRYWEKDEGTREALAAERPVAPSLHAAISEALGRFAGRLAPEIVDRCEGQLIYSGGDDLMAALPLERALDCVGALREAYSSFEVMGSRATVSAGIVVAHEKEDLRAVLRAAREAESEAKARGKNRGTISVLRRSGEHSTALLPWGYMETLKRQVADFGGGTSDRWAYQLRRQMDTLAGLPEEAFESELRRLVKRSEGQPMQFVDDYRQYRGLLGSSARDGYVSLCQSASFMARGRD